MQSHYKMVDFLSKSGLSGPVAWGPGLLEIQWGPCEILPEGSVDPQNWRIYNFNEGTLQNFVCLGTFEIHMVRPVDAQQKCLPGALQDIHKHLIAYPLGQHMRVFVSYALPWQFPCRMLAK